MSAPLSVRHRGVEEEWTIPDFAVSAELETRECRGCHDPILWVVTTNGKRMPINRDGVSHFATCPMAADFRRPR